MLIGLTKLLNTPGVEVPTLHICSLAGRLVVYPQSCHEPFCCFSESMKILCAWYDIQDFFKFDWIVFKV